MSFVKWLRFRYLMRRLARDPARTVPRLGELGDRRAVPALLEILSDPKRYSTDVVVALGRLGDPRGVGPLVKKMGQAYTGEERVLMAKALASLGHPEWCDLVCGNNDDWGRIANSGKTGNDMAHLALGAALDVLAYAQLKLDALAHLGDKRAVQAILNFLCSNWETGSMRVAAAATLAKLGEPTWANLITGENSDWQALAGTKDVRLIDPLTAAVHDVVRQEHKLLSRKEELRRLASLEHSPRPEDRVQWRLMGGTLSDLGAKKSSIEQEATSVERVLASMQRVRTAISEAIESLSARTDS